MISTTTRKRALGAAASLAFWLCLWQLCAWRVGTQLLLPAPAAVARRLGELAVTGEFWAVTALSLGRVALGLLWGAAAGMLLAGATCAWRWADAVLSPAIRVVRAAPVASFILLVQLWIRRDLVPVLISGLMVLPVVWAGVSQGIRECDRKLLELARVYRFSRGRTLRLVLLPSVRPCLLSALTTSMGLAWKSGVAAEALCWPRLAIGTQIYSTKLYLETADLFAWTLVAVALSLTLERLIAGAVRRWERGRRA